MKAMVVDHSAISASRPRGLARIAIFSFLAAATMAAWFLREPLRNLVFAEGVIANDGPTQETIE